MGWYSYGNFRPYVSVGQRRRQAERKIAKLRKSGYEVSPVEIDGRKIARTFWGHAWCRNLEAYSDFENRLPRGRTYVRNGSVIDLQIEAGRVRALVSGSEIYEVEIEIEPLAKKRWASIKSECSGKIDSLVELLQGSFSKGVMEIVSRKGEGLFPSPREISLRCSCPDWATMCKHVAATLYGVGARLDQEPELLFELRGADPAEMVADAVEQPSVSQRAGKGRRLATDQLSSVFGVDIDMGEYAVEAGAPKKVRRKKTGTKRATKKANSKSAAKGPPTKKRSATRKATGGRKATPRKAVSKARTRTASSKSSGAGERPARGQQAKKKKVAGGTTPRRRTARKKSTDRR